MQFDQERADRFAAEWIGAWNAHDLEAILAHYADDVEFHSPFAIEFSDAGDGVLRGKDALRAYWSRALAGLPDLRFEGPYVVAAGIGSITIVYRSVRDLIGVEQLTFSADGFVTASRCHYRTATDARLP